MVQAALKQSLLGVIYANRSKVKGVDQDPRNNEAIYQRYLQAYKKGVFNYIKKNLKVPLRALVNIFPEGWLP